MNLPSGEELRVMVAETQGFKDVQVGPWYGYVENGDAKAVPNYPEDLNACAVFERKMTDEDAEAYLEHLNVACGADVEKGESSFVPYFATARQRCVAFLMAKGKIK